MDRQKGYGGRGGRRGYHHGNLREALINAALGLISEKGTAGFTFADAARAAGVSAAAPYRHFRDRDALMADVAQRGFEQLEGDLALAAAKGDPSPVAAIDRIARAYLDFTRREPAQFSAMFESGQVFTESSEVRLAADRVFNVMLDACKTLVETQPADQRAPAMMIALHINALTHGVASLFARGDESRRPIPMPPEQLLEAGILVYLEGLGINAD
ncbi:MAG: TetR-like C-terminal domain-containing protein [Pseudomonadota bacterium]